MGTQLKGFPHSLSKSYDNSERDTFSYRKSSLYVWALARGGSRGGGVLGLRTLPLSGTPKLHKEGKTSPVCVRICLIFVLNSYLEPPPPLFASAPALSLTIDRGSGRDSEVNQLYSPTRQRNRAIKLVPGLGARTWQDKPTLRSRSMSDVCWECQRSNRDKSSISVPVGGGGGVKEKSMTSTWL